MADSVNPIVRVPDAYGARVTAARSTPGAGAAAAPAPRPAVAIQMQEALQTRRLSTLLFSTLITQDGRFLRAPSAAPARASALFGAAAAPSHGVLSPLVPSRGAADSLASVRVAEDIIQAASARPPTAEGRRIAAEAFLMEAQAQRDFVTQQVQGMAGRRQWMA
jgi:hypothetical protein